MGCIVYIVIVCRRRSWDAVRTVVPGSGTGELAGLSGTMAIDIVDGEHFYEFEYALADGS